MSAPQPEQPAQPAYLNQVDRFVDAPDIVAAIAVPLIHAGVKGLHWEPVLEGFVASIAGRNVVSMAGLGSEYTPITSGLLVGASRQFLVRKRGNFMNGFVEGASGQAVANALTGVTQAAFDYTGIPLK